MPRLAFEGTMNHNDPMDDALLATLLESESDRCDWKEKGDPQKIVATLAAFANDHAAVGGGWVICGVREVERGQRVVGQPIGLTAAEIKQIRGKVEHWCRTALHPALMPRVERHRTPTGAELLCFYMPAQPRVVSMQHGRGHIAYYVRIADAVREATPAVLEELYRRKGIEPPFLDQPCGAATLADLDLDLARRTLSGFDLPQTADAYLAPDAPIEATARPLVRCVRDREGERAVPTYLAILLFGRVPTRFVPGAQIDVATYAGRDRGVEHSALRRFSGPLVTLVEQVRVHLASTDVLEIDKGAPLGRQNRPRLPRRAIEEALVNAVVHRDYADANPSKIAVFDDRIEFGNPGGLVPALDADRVRAGDAGPHWRNPSLAAFMLRLELAQTEGQGLRTIIDEARRVTGRPATIDPQPGRFSVAIPIRREARATAAPVSRGAGLLLVSIGGPSIEAAVSLSLGDFGLASAPVLLDFVWEAPIDAADPRAWDEVSIALRDAVSACVDRPGIEAIHLFYRGPVVFAAVLGALVVPHRPLRIHPWEAGRYFEGPSVDRAFLRGGT